MIPHLSPLETHFRHFNHPFLVQFQRLSNCFSSPHTSFAAFQQPAGTWVMHVYENKKGDLTITHSLLCLLNIHVYFLWLDAVRKTAAVVMNE